MPKRKPPNPLLKITPPPKNLNNLQVKLLLHQHIQHAPHIKNLPIKNIPPLNKL